MMKKLYFIVCFVFLSLWVTAQVPQGIPYQAAARNATGQILANTQVLLRFSIIDSIANGTMVYQETHNLTTNSMGLFSTNIGMGSAVIGTFNTINWGQNFKFLKVELDTSALGNNYIDMGTQQMMSVPYALYAGTITNGTNGVDTFYVGNNNFGNVGNWNQGGNFSKIATVDSINNFQNKKKIKVSLHIDGIGYHPQNANSGQCILAIKDTLGNNVTAKFTIDGNVSVTQSIQMNLYNVSRNVLVEFIADSVSMYKLYANAWGFNWSYGWNGITIQTPIWEYLNY
jgi:hypothetical protein